MNFFENIEQAPGDAIFGIQLAYQADKRPYKINLGVGVYRDSYLKPHVLNVVKKAEVRILEKNLSKEYLPIDGDSEFTKHSFHLVYGSAISQDCMAKAQSIGGTGALRIGAQFLNDLGLKNVFVSDPTWDNHYRIFSQAGMHVRKYPYYDALQKKVNFAKMVEFFKQVSRKSVIVLQSSCHNPTGNDLTQNEWKELAELFKERELFSFFDFAYQGFGEGIEEDAWAVRYFASQGLQSACAASYSKNFGLYAERIGTLFFVCKDPKEAANVRSQIKVKIRGIYSNPPCHGARIISTILEDPTLNGEWRSELDEMRNRIKIMRSSLDNNLKKRLETRNIYEGIGLQKGMFSFSGLSASQVVKVTDAYGIYLPLDGRINVAGLNEENLTYVADALAEIAKLDD